MTNCRGRGSRLGMSGASRATGPVERGISVSRGRVAENPVSRPPSPASGRRLSGAYAPGELRPPAGPPARWNAGSPYPAAGLRRTRLPGAGRTYRRANRNCHNPSWIVRRFTHKHARSAGCQCSLRHCLLGLAPIAFAPGSGYNYDIIARNGVGAHSGCLRVYPGYGAGGKRGGEVGDGQGNCDGRAPRRLDGHPLRHMTSRTYGTAP